MYHLWIKCLAAWIFLKRFNGVHVMQAKAPMFPNEPFLVFWNAPTTQCRLRYKVDLDLKTFHIVPNANESLSGSAVTIFYPTHLGVYPHIDDRGHFFNGIIPQNESLVKHLNKSKSDINRMIPLRTFHGLGVIDWENWRPQWDRNWGSKNVYRNRSIQFARDLHPELSEDEIKRLAKREYEKAAKSFMRDTLLLAEEMRPDGYWGYYLYPDCQNYNYKTKTDQYTGECPDIEMSRNDQLLWLWRDSTALFPNIYLETILRSSDNALKFVHHRLKEAMRIASMARKDYALPVFVYARPFYAYTFEPLTQEDLVTTVGETAAMGAAGIVFWGSMQYASTVVCSTFWLQMSFMWSSALALKSAQLPVFQRMPFIAAWNAPTDHCSIRYNITISLKMFHVIGSPFAKARGQNVTIFYVNRLGYYPWYTSQEIPINGGLPQNFSLQTHLEKANQDINYYIPDKDFTGLAVIDWEHWRPQWERNWNTKNIYKRQSRKLISKLQENISANAIEGLAKFSFEKCAKAFMKETIELGIKSRPKGLWGYYLYPDCHNYNFHEQNYTGSCPENELMRNNELLWLWNSSAALYPSIGIKKSLGSSENTLRFSQFRVKESMRISFMTSHDYSLPVFVYTRLDYRDQPLLFLSTQDLVSTIGESAALGAAGIVIWGDMNLTSSEANCTKVKEFIATNLGPYITNVTKAAEVCSQHLCQNNGRCIRRNWKALDYLHLNPQNFQIKTSENGIIVRGVASSTDLQTMAEKFTCHCYQGFEGGDCRKIKTSGWQPGHSVSLISPRILIMINFVSFIF